MRWWGELWPLVMSIAFIAGVLGNLAASAILGVPALLHLHRKLDRQHGERMEQADRHHREQLEVLRGSQVSTDSPGRGRA